MPDLGDITEFLKESSVPNLDWVDVDEKMYREMDQLPLQNVDVIPDLVAAWSHEDKPASRYVPNRGSDPKTMGDLSKEHGFLRSSPKDIRRVARMVLMMQGHDPGRWRHAMEQRFDLGSMRSARTVLTETLGERGLLGTLYVAASDFPTCASKAKETYAFVRRYANEARYVVAKPECQGCVHALRGAGVPTCAVFHKQIVVDVPYSEELADTIEQEKRAAGREIVASQDVPKERIRRAFLSKGVTVASGGAMPKPVENVQRLLRTAEPPVDVPLPENLVFAKDAVKQSIATALFEGRYTMPQAQQALQVLTEATTPHAIEAVRLASLGQHAPAPAQYAGAGIQPKPGVVAPPVVDQQLIAASALTRKRDEQARDLVAQQRALPVVNHVRHELLRGRSMLEVVAGLRLAFDPRVVVQTRDQWEPWLQQAGLYGAVYSTQDSFDSCHTGSDFLAKHNPGVKAIVRGTKCEGCIYNKMARCLLYGRSLVGSPHEVETPAMVAHVFQEHKTAGRLAAWDTQYLAQPPRDALRNMFDAVSANTANGVAKAGARDTVFRAFRGGPASGDHGTRPDIRASILMRARRLMNEGLYGPSLVRVLKTAFEVRDLQAVAKDLKQVTANQGLQGVYFVDPTVHDDYGHGCDEAGRLFRAKQVPYALMGPKCSSCVLQTRPGFCSKLHKPLVESAAHVPYPGNKTDVQRAVLASGEPTSVDFTTIVNNGASMMAEFEMQRAHAAGDIDLAPVAASTPITVQFGSGDIVL